MADGNFPTLISKDTTANVLGNPIYVQLSDGSAAVGVTSGGLDVNIENSSIAVTGAFYRDLVKGTSAGEDNVLIFANTNKDGSGTDYVPLVDSDGQLQVDVLTMPTVTVSASALDIRDIVAGAGATGDNIGIMANTVKDGTAGTFYYPLVDADGQLQVDVLTAPAIRTITKASDSIQISKDTAVNSSTNPIYVAFTTDVISATEIHDYATAADTGNNDYTVTGTTFLLKSVIFAASGAMKAEIQTGPVGTLVSKAVGFIPKAGGTEQLFFDPPIEVPVTSTGTVRVVMTNREGSAMSVYSTIIGNDLP